MRHFFAALSLVGVLATPALAVPITGSITFGGTLNPSTQLGTTTALDFTPPTFVTSSAGDLATVVVGSQATFNDMTFAPFTGATNPLWTANGFQFDLTAVTVDSQTANGLVLLGHGTMSKSGFDSTAFDWSFSADRLRNVVAWSATNETTVTAEPTTLLLLGTGLLLVGRRWNKQ